MPDSTGETGLSAPTALHAVRILNTILLYSRTNELIFANVIIVVFPMTRPSETLDYNTGDYGSRDGV